LPGAFDVPAKRFEPATMSPVQTKSYLDRLDQSDMYFLHANFDAAQILEVIHEIVDDEQGIAVAT
jgi:hypothetical protein